MELGIYSFVERTADAVTGGFLGASWLGPTQGSAQSFWLMSGTRHAGRVNGFMTTGKRVVMEGDSLPDLFIGASWKGIRRNDSVRQAGAILPPRA